MTKNSKANGKYEHTLVAPETKYALLMCDYCTMPTRHFFSSSTLVPMARSKNGEAISATTTEFRLNFSCQYCGRERQWGSSWK